MELARGTGADRQRPFLIAVGCFGSGYGGPIAPACGQDCGARVPRPHDLHLRRSDGVSELEPFCAGIRPCNGMGQAGDLDRRIRVEPRGAA